MLKVSSIISGNNKQAIDSKQGSIRKNQISFPPRGFRPKRKTARPTERTHYYQPEVEVEAPSGVLGCRCK